MSERPLALSAWMSSVSLIKWTMLLCFCGHLFSFFAIYQVVDLQVFALPRITLKPLVPTFPCFAKILVSLMEKVSENWWINYLILASLVSSFSSPFLKLLSFFSATCRFWIKASWSWCYVNSWSLQICAGMTLSLLLHLPALKHFLALEFSVLTEF